MAPSDIQRVKQIFNDAAGLKGSERAAFLERVCAGDTELQAEVEAFLHAAEQTKTFLGSDEARSEVRRRFVPLAEQPGTKIDRYKLLQQIGEGGFGVVFMAEQEVPVRRTVALKIIKLGMDTKQVVARFEAERQALAMMDHPNIAKVLDAGSTDTGRPYFVMELVKGVPITDYCDSANLATEARLGLFMPVCHAVQHAHQKGIIHRDIKPSNVLITLHDGTPVPKVIDFGIAKATHGRLTDRTLFTEYRTMVGTPEYMSPEQAEMSGLDIDTRADIYSLGVLLYELLTGVTPFDGKQLREAAFAEIQRIIREVDPPKPSTRISTLGKTLTTVAARRQSDPAKLSVLVRGDLDWIVMKALEKDRTRRYDSATALAQDVQRHLTGEPVNAAPPSTRYRVSKFVRRNRGPVLAATIVAGVLVLGLIGTGLGLAWAIRAERDAIHQKSFAIIERDKSVLAEADAGRQKIEAVAQARRAQQLYGEGLITHGDALITASEFRNAYTKFDEARGVVEKLGESLGRLDLSLVRLFRLSPPPLWSIKIDELSLFHWTVLESRNELITVDRSGNFVAIDLLTGSTLRTFGEATGVRELCGVETRDGPLLITGSLDSVQVLDAVTGRLIREAQDGRGAGYIAALPDGSVVSTDQGGTASFWNFNSMAVRKQVRIDGPSRSFAFSPDGSLVAFLGSSASDIYVCNTRDGTSRTTIVLPPQERGNYTSGSGLRSLCFTADGKAVLCGETDGKLVYAPLAGPVRTLAKPHDTNIDSICASSDGRRIFTSSEEGTIRGLELINGVTWAPSLTLTQKTSGRTSMHFLPGTGPKICGATFGIDPQDQGAVVGLSVNGDLSVWPAAGLINRPNTLHEGLNCSRDGLLLAGTSTDGVHGSTVEVRDGATGRTLRTVDDNVWSRSTAFAPDGKSLYCATPWTLLRSDLFRNQAIWRVEAHDKQPLACVAASADGRFVASGSEGEGIVRIWDSATGALKHSLPGQGRSVWAVAFAPVATSDTAHQPSRLTEHLLVGPGDSAFITDWNFESIERTRRAASTYVRAFSVWPDQSKVAVTGGGSRIDLIDLKTFSNSGSLGPLPMINYNFALVTPGGTLGRWAVSQGRNDVRVWDVENHREEFTLVRNVDGQGTNTMIGTPDGSTVTIRGLRSFDFTLPRTRRAMMGSPDDLVARADYYARIGLWGWADQLVERATAAGRIVPEITRARTAWMCGRYDSAKESFARAAKAGEVPQYYADLCASVGDEPPRIKLCDAVPRTPDVFSIPTTNVAASEGAISAADIPRLRSMIQTEVTVEGVVGLSSWSTSGKVLNIGFLNQQGEPEGMLCVIFKTNRQQFDAAFGGDAANTFANARLRVRGKIVRYAGYATKLKDWPEMILTDPSQVTILK